MVSTYAFSRMEHEQHLLTLAQSLVMLAAHQTRMAASRSAISPSRTVTCTSSLCLRSLGALVPKPVHRPDGGTSRATSTAAMARRPCSRPSSSTPRVSTASSSPLRTRSCHGPTQNWWQRSFPRRRSPATSVNMTRWSWSTKLAACSIQPAALLSLIPRSIRSIDKGHPMHYRTLGNSGAVVSTFALGTMTFGAEADEVTSHAILDDYVAAGGNFIDTADVYGSGVSEEIIGRWLAAHRAQGEQVVIATKGRFEMGDGSNDLGTSRRHRGRALDASLRRLGVEQIDLYQMHAWDAVTPLQETLRFLDDAVRAGKIAYCGFSHFLRWQMTKAVHLARANGFTPPVTLQPQYSLLVREIESEIVPAALDANIGLLPWSPLAGGWLTGKYQRDADATGATRLGEDPKRGMEAWEPRNKQERTWRILDTVQEIAKAKGVNQGQVSLAWLEAQPAVTSVILGVRNTDQLADNLGAASVELTPDELKRLDEVSAPVVSDYPYGAAGADQRHRAIDVSD